MKIPLTRLIIVGFILIFCMINIGCRSATPPTVFYTLTPISSDQLTGVIQDSLNDISLGIGPINFPKILERPQIVTRPSLNTLALSEFERWGGDLRQDFLNVLTQNISMITGSDRIFKYPLLGGMEPDFHVAMDIYRFDGRQGESVELSVSWMLSRKQADANHVVFKKSIIKQAVSGDGYDAMVRAQSEVLKTFSREIVEEIKQAGE